MHSTTCKCNWIITTLAISGFFSCTIGSKPQAVAMNNMMVQINDSLFLMGRDFGNKVGDAVTSRNFRSLAPVRQRFEDFIDSSSAHLSAMKDVYGSGSMRKTEIDLLGMEKKMVVNDFGAFERLSSFATMQEITGLFDKIKEESKAESDKRSNFIREQRIYAKRNGYELALNGMAQ